MKNHILLFFLLIFYISGCGNLTSSSTSAANQQTISSSLTYDSKNRFVISIANPLEPTDKKHLNSKT